MSARHLFPAGAKFKVIKEGAYLTGMKPMTGYGGAYSGWQQNLHVGDVIQSLGFGPGWGSDPGYGIHWTTEKARVEHVSFVEFKPNGSGNWFTYWPAEGYLERVEDE